MDLFELLKAMCGCACISDMAYGRPYNEQACLCISFMRLENYDLHVLTDMYQYLTGKSMIFESKERAVISLCELSSTYSAFYNACI